MDRNRKKVKMEKEENEEEKMELYTFLKNAREMKKHMISSMEKKRQEEEERARVCRFPSFQPEDFIFMNKAADTTSSSASNEYSSKEKQEGSETSVCLDLKLSL